MGTILRQVKTETRTPKESGSYPTFIGNKWFNVKTGLWTEFCPSEVDDNQTPITLVYWLEVVELPNDMDLYEKFLPIKSPDEKVDLYCKGKILGAQWLRDFVLAATPK